MNQRFDVRRRGRSLSAPHVFFSCLCAHIVSGCVKASVWGFYVETGLYGIYDFRAGERARFCVVLHSEHDKLTQSTLPICQIWSCRLTCGHGTRGWPHWKQCVCVILCGGNNSDRAGFFSAAAGAYTLFLEVLKRGGSGFCVELGLCWES